MIMDPSGQAIQFLQNEYREQKIIVTSFLDAGFRKQLESALRFGSPIVIQDADCYDPLLNAVLNREIHRSGGRVLIRLQGGNSQPIDFSPLFRLFLFTRDSSYQFAPDLSSRVTFVNFTITPASLKTQCLARILAVERPDVEEKNRSLLRAQGEFRARLYTLEQSLLQALNDARGNILDDDGEASVLATLEKLKREAADITEKMQSTESVMKEVDSVSKLYMPLARTSSSVYFFLEKQMPLVHRFYQFGLDFFIRSIFEPVLSMKSEKNAVAPAERVLLLLQLLFQFTYERVMPSLLFADRPVLCFHLARLFIASDDEFDLATTLFDLSASSSSADELKLDGRFSTEQTKRLSSLAASVEQFKSIAEAIASQSGEWDVFLTHHEPENHVPVCWKQDSQRSKFSYIFI
jgi:dynein heavy chain 1